MNKNTKMIRTQIYLPKKMLDWLKVEAQRESNTTAHIIRRAVSYYQQHKIKTYPQITQEKVKLSDSGTHSRPKATQTAGKFLLQMALEAQKNNVKGPKDLAQNVDKYLYGNI